MNASSEQQKSRGRPGRSIIDQSEERQVGGPDGPTFVRVPGPVPYIVVGPQK